MSLRVRLALVFAGVAVLVAVCMGAISYAVASERLQREADQALAEAVAPYLMALREGRPVTEDRRGRPGRDDRFSQYPIQLVQPDGTTVALAGPAVALPVDAQDLALAQSDQEVQRYRTDAAAGVPVRMVTASSGNAAGAVQAARDFSESRAVLRSLAVTLSLIGFGVAVLAALGGWLLARQMTGRLVALTDAAETVGQTGRLDVSVPGAGRDEVGRLAAAFNGMLARLSASRDQQHRLVQDVGHELRTPLTSLRTNVELLRQFDMLPPMDRQRVLADLAGETGELTMLVNEVIDLGTDAPLNPEPVPVPLAAVVGRAVARARRRTAREVLLQADDSVVLGNAAAVERAVWNLLDNAVKFAPEGPIEVTVEQGALLVADHGPGIPPQDLPHVFDRFYRATAARSRPGSGLGLSIVAEVARTHGGSVAAGPRSDGTPGAVLRLTLPLA
jgi:two-component system sensor histidine kinase MprB